MEKSLMIKDEYIVPKSMNNYIRIISYIICIKIYEILISKNSPFSDKKKNEKMNTYLIKYKCKNKVMYFIK